VRFAIAAKLWNYFSFRNFLLPSSFLICDFPLRLNVREADLYYSVADVGGRPKTNFDKGEGRARGRV